MSNSNDVMHDVPAFADNISEYAATQTHVSTDAGFIRVAFGRRGPYPNQPVFYLAASLPPEAAVDLAQKLLAAAQRG